MNAVSVRLSWKTFLLCKEHERSAVMFYKGRHFIDLTHTDDQALRDFFYETKSLEWYYRQRITDSRNQNTWFLSSILTEKGIPIPVIQIFFQESTRTRFATRIAIQAAGGTVADVIDPRYSSMAKGESLEATVRTFILLGYRFIILRYRGPVKDAARQLADMCEEEDLPASIISAGENNTHHPLQALCDLFTVFQAKEKDFLAGNLRYAVIGDMESRTIHDFLYGLSYFGAKKIWGVSGVGNNLPSWVTGRLARQRIPFEKTSHLCSIAPENDVFYFTRYQQEYRRWYRTLRALGLLGLFERHWYAKWFGATALFRDRMRADAIALHPLPHGPEFSSSLHREDKRFLHYEPMIMNSICTKMALFKQLTRLEWKMER